jgi:hypothetical protein
VTNEGKLDREILSQDKIKKHSKKTKEDKGEQPKKVSYSENTVDKDEWDKFINRDDHSNRKNNKDTDKNKQF